MKADEDESGRSGQSRSGDRTPRQQAVRLTRLTDVVYAVALVLIVQWLPLPGEGVEIGDGVRLGTLWAVNFANLIAALLGLVFVILYWLRSNTLLSAVDRTDGVHSALSIASLFALLMLLYMVRIGGDVVDSSRRAGESLTMALIGVAAGAAWWHARRKGLVREEITSEESADAQVQAFAEPMAALITLPFAFVGEAAWNLSWLVYLPIAWVLRRRGGDR